MKVTLAPVSFTVSDADWQKDSCIPRIVWRSHLLKSPRRAFRKQRWTRLRWLSIRLYPKRANENCCYVTSAVFHCPVALQDAPWCWMEFFQRLVHSKEQSNAATPVALPMPACHPALSHCRSDRNTFALNTKYSSSGHCLHYVVVSSFCYSVTLSLGEATTRHHRPHFPRKDPVIVMKST